MQESMNLCLKRLRSVGYGIEYYDNSMTFLIYDRFTAATKWDSEKSLLQTSNDRYPGRISCVEILKNVCD